MSWINTWTYQVYKLNKHLNSPRLWAEKIFEITTSMSWTNVWTHHFYELGKSKPHLDGEAIRVVAHGSDEPIVVAQQVVVQSLRLRVGHCSTDHRQKERHKHALHLRPSPPLKGNGRKISLGRWNPRGKEDLGFALRRRISWERVYCRHHRDRAQNWRSQFYSQQ